MIDKYLRFDSEPQANSVLYTEVPTEWDDEGMPTAWYTQPNYANIDTIGVIYEGGEWDDEGNVITEPAALSGWHVNVRLVNGENIEALEPFAVQPKTLLRVWG